MTGPSPASGRRLHLPQISLTLWAALAALIVGVVAALVVGSYGGGSEQVVVASRNLPAFHRVMAGDVKLKGMARSAIPDGAIRSLSAARGHYTLQLVDSGKTLTQDSTGPSATTGTVVIPLPIRNDSLDGITPGARVNLLLAPTGSSGNATVIPKVEVVEEKQTAAGDQVVYLAIPAECQQAVAQAAGRSRVILARLNGNSAGTP